MTKLWYLADYFERKLNWNSENLTERLNKGAKETSTGAYKSVQKCSNLHRGSYKSVQKCSKINTDLYKSVQISDYKNFFTGFSVLILFFLSIFANAEKHIIKGKNIQTSA